MNEQISFGDHLSRPKPHFDGDDYKPKRDLARLTGQIERVWKFMSDGKWHTLDAIAEGTGDPHASVSAQLRNLRKERFGSWTIERRHVRAGLYEPNFLLYKPKRMIHIGFIRS